MCTLRLTPGLAVLEASFLLLEASASSMKARIFSNMVRAGPAQLSSTLRSRGCLIGLLWYCRALAPDVLPTVIRLNKLFLAGKNKCTKQKQSFLSHAIWGRF